MLTEGRGYLFLWNPMIAKHKKIPYEARAWKPGVGARIYGLGYHSDEDDMKVLCFVQRGGFVEAGELESKLTSKLKVYSLASGTWKMIEKLPPSNLQFDPSFGRMVWFNNSCVAWLMSDAESCASGFVLTLDILEEEYRAFPIPVEVNDVAHSELFAWGGSLCYWRDEHDSTTVWIMKDSSWSTLKLSFKMNMNMCHPLFFDGERFLLMLEFYDQTDEHCSRCVQKVVWYTVKTQECESTKTRRSAGGITTSICSVGCLRLLVDGDPDGRINYFGAPLT
ncbi:F-box protein At4g22390-like [Rosa rugosa]|uniref:F-box protein At4g22390-like n=1 Tax=Rosa rugosa TaxID=74645 RepID=UPI002B406136|nr:F-box protein At4g22390-like [Rosa rugosa]